MFVKSNRMSMWLTSSVLVKNGLYVPGEVDRSRDYMTNLFIWDWLVCAGRVVEHLVEGLPQAAPVLLLVLGDAHHAANKESLAYL